MKFLITGASGLLGRAITRHLEFDRNHEVISTGFTRATDKIKKLDVTNTAKVSEFIDSIEDLDIFIHCAAERRPDIAEKNKEATEILNSLVPYNLAKLCAERDIFFIYISTDYVFAGDKAPYEINDDPRPLNFYGLTKREGEISVHKASQEISLPHVQPLILRVPVLYGDVITNDESAVNILIDIIMNPKKQVKMDHYAKRYPTNVDDIAKILVKIAEKRMGHKNDKDFPTILHFSANQCFTKYEMCQILSEILNVPIDHLIPQTTDDPNASASRPYDCQLSTKAMKNLGIEIDTIDFKTWFEKNLIRRH